MKPYTAKAKKAIDLATRISKKMNYNYVGTEHILAGLLKEGTGVAAEVLATVAVRPTARFFGIMTPCAPARFAVRMIAPRLCGSSILSNKNIKGSSPFSFANIIY